MNSKKIEMEKTNNNMFGKKIIENVQLRVFKSVENPEMVKSEDKNNYIVPDKKSLSSYVVPLCGVFRSKLKLMSIEIITFLYICSATVRNISSTNLILDKVCLVHFGLPENVCSHLSDHLELKSEIEKLANNYNLGHSLIVLLPSAVISLFVGSWSDKYSRKLPVIASLIGIIIDGVGSIACVYFFKSRVEYYFIPAIFNGITGGVVVILTVVYSYVSDISTSGNRTMKYALLEMSMSISIPVGSLAGGWIFKYYGYAYVFLISTLGHILALFWVIFLLEETRGFDNKYSWMEKFWAFWSIDAIVDSFKATIKYRPNRGRQKIWCLIIGMSVSFLSFASIGGVSFLFVYHVYDWDNTTFSTVYAIFTLLTLIITLIIVSLSKKYHVRDAILGIAGSISAMLKFIGTGLAFSEELYYLVNVLGLASSLVSLSGRSMISKIVTKEDIGKVFAFLTATESILPVATTAAVSQIYNVSLDFFPGLVFVLMGSMVIITTGLFIWLASLPDAAEEQSNGD